MTWVWILAACAIAYATKLLGYLLPGEWLDHPLVARIASAITVSLLASLIVLNTVGGPRGITLDARLLAVLAAGILAWRRVPFLVIVIAGAATTAVARLFGFP